MGTSSSQADAIGGASLTVLFINSKYSASVVVFSSAHIGCAELLGVIGDRLIVTQRRRFHPLLQQCLDGSVTWRLDRQRLLAGTFQTARCKLLSQSQDAQRRAVALLGVRLLRITYS